jgi:hypothetical protein
MDFESLPDQATISEYSQDEEAPDPLLQYLDDEDAVADTLENVPVSEFDEQRRTRLQMLVAKYCSSTQPGAAKKKPKSNTPKTPQIPGVRGFLNLAKTGTLMLPADITTYIGAWGAAPDSFMDCKTLVYGANIQTNSGDAFVASYNFTQDLIANRTTSAVKYLFLILFFYDLVELVKTTSKMGHNQVGKLAQFMENIKKNTCNIDPQVAATNMVEWWKLRTRLVILVDVFGPGCIFFLATELNNDFLKNKLRSKGANYDTLMDLLRDDLKLQETMQSTGADSLGIALRRHLLKPFDEAVKGYNALKRRRE